MSAADRYWDQFLESLPFAVRPRSRYVEAFSFGFDEEDARTIAPLVADGIKAATGSLLWSIEADGKSVPAVDDHWVVLSGPDAPACIIRTEQVEILPYDEVPSIYARLGGEGDRSMAGWRRMYWRYIESECARLGRASSAKAPLVMERFECLYAEPLV